LAGTVTALRHFRRGPSIGGAVVVVAGLWLAVGVRVALALVPGGRPSTPALLPPPGPVLEPSTREGQDEEVRT